jgi:hypothetical protein
MEYIVCKNGAQLPVSRYTYEAVVSKQDTASLWEAISLILRYGSREDMLLYQEAYDVGRRWGSTSIRIKEALPTDSFGRLESVVPQVDETRKAFLLDKVKRYVVYFRDIPKNKLISYLVSLESTLTHKQALTLIRKLEANGSIFHRDHTDTYGSSMSWGAFYD